MTDGRDPTERTSGAPPIALVHGFTQTSVSWAPVVRALRDQIGPERTVVAVDVPGHGERSSVHTDLIGAADLLADEVGRAAWVGYSLGGRLALHLALHRPEAVEQLVLVGATAGLSDPDERSARRADDEALAEQIERDGVHAFLDRWLARPLFAGLTPRPDDLTARRANTSAGLAGSLRLAGTGAQEPLWDELHRIRIPVLVLAGGRDDKFAELGRRLVDHLPQAELVLVPDAGHAAHLEQPEVTAAIIADRLGRTAGRSPA